MLSRSIDMEDMDDLGIICDIDNIKGSGGHFWSRDKKKCMTETWNVEDLEFSVGMDDAENMEKTK